MIDLMKHHEAKAKANPQGIDPIAGAINATQVINVYNEDDFDLQFEALTQALAEEAEVIHVSICRDTRFEDNTILLVEACITQFGMTVFSTTDARQGKKYLAMILIQSRKYL